jgi:hypothetical protein
VGPIPEIKYFGADEMSEGERMHFMSWYDEQKDSLCRYVLEQYCQDSLATGVQILGAIL